MLFAFLGKPTDILSPVMSRLCTNHAQTDDDLTQLHITYPMLFEVINGAKSKSTHAGVLEFTAEEGRCYLPFWVSRRIS